MTKIVVIGSNSFSGSHFVNTILEKTDYEIIGISRSKEHNKIFLPYKEKNLSRFRFYKLDLNKDLKEIINLLEKEKTEFIVNYVAQGMVAESWNSPKEWFKTNCLSTVDFIDNLRRMDFLMKYIHISTNEVYGSCNNVSENAPLMPSTPYATSKAAADMFVQNLIKQFNFPADIVRSTNVYGPGQQLFRIIPRTIIGARTNQKIRLDGGGIAKKSYLYIGDNCDGTLKIMQNNSSGEVYNLSPDSAISIADLVKKVANLMGKNLESIAEIGEERLGQDAEYTLNSNKIRKKLDWNPKIGLEEGIYKCITWVDKNWEIIKGLSLKYEHKT